MYMNCAPITVTGASVKTKRTVHGQRHSHGMSVSRRASAMASLPEMFVANIGNGCSTAESGTTLAIPEQHLGTNVQHIGSDTPIPPVGSCGVSKDGASAKGADPPSVQISAVPPAPAPTPSAAAANPPPTSQAPPPPPSPSAQPQAPSPPLAVISATPTSVSPAPPPPVTSGLKSGTCNTPGRSLCQPDGMGFGTCDEQGRVIFAPAPLGTKCDPTLGVLVQANANVRLFKA